MVRFSWFRRNGAFWAFYPFPRHSREEPALAKAGAGIQNVNRVQTAKFCGSSPSWSFRQKTAVLGNHPPPFWARFVFLEILSNFFTSFPTA